MKKIAIVVAAFFLVAGIVYADSIDLNIGDSVLRIHAGSQSSPNASTRDLEHRIWMLERAVQQLQNQVYRLSEQPPRREEAKTYSCYLKSTFNTFTATGATKNEAKGNVLKECEKSSGSIFCKEKDVKCGD